MSQRAYELSQRYFGSGLERDVPYVDCNSDTPFCCGCRRWVTEVCYNCGYCEDCCSCDGGWEKEDNEPGAF